MAAPGVVFQDGRIWGADSSNGPILQKVRSAVVGQHLNRLRQSSNRKPVMSSRAATQTATERRVRRLAQRRGLSLLIAQKRNPKIEAHGGYMLRDDETFAIVFGNARYDFSADLDEVEAWLDSQDTADG